MHEEHHKQIRQQAQEIITTHRDKLGLEPQWKIDVRVFCPEYKDRAALVQWIPDRYEAMMFFACDLLPDQMLKEVVHEIVELSLYRSGTIIHQFANRYRGARDIADFFMSQYRIARNQEVEQIVSLYLKEVCCAGTN